MSDTETDSRNSAETGLAARAVALDVLRDVLRRNEALDDALAANQELGELDPRDRAFARMIVATTLRRLGQIDALIALCVSRPLPARAVPVTDILRTGICQLAFMRTPAHAAVDAAVRLTAVRRQTKFKSLVNAVLRRIARDGDALLNAQDAARLNTPGWMWESWSATLGEEICRRIAEAHMAEPPLDFSVKDGPGNWAETLGGEVLPTGSVRRAHGGPVPDLPGFADGAWWVQDAAAALPVHLMAGGLDGALSGKRVIDLCAAPGGKTAQLVAAGAYVVAVERSTPRLERLRENLARLTMEIETIRANGEEWRPDAPADAVLVDAPCSATGTIRRHPDILWTKRPEEVGRLAGAQARLLKAAAEMVRPGGCLVYGVCSLEAEEGPARVGAFLQAHSEFARLPVGAEEIGGITEAVTDAGDLMTLPCHLADRGGMDGFYAARLIRKG